MSPTYISHRAATAPLEGGGDLTTAAVAAPAFPGDTPTPKANEPLAR